MKPSKRFTLNKQDVEKWAKNAAIFFAPAALLFLTELQTGHSFKEALVAIKLWGFNIAIDLIKKFIAGK